MFGREAEQVFAIFEAAGAECYIVGGAVRDYLLGAPIKDIDFSVSMPPDEMLRTLQQAKVKYIETGIKHGTITALIDGKSFEITSFRKDVKTDGRHAVVEFGNTLGEDAIRRDFTINALYMNAKGEVIDPLGVIADIEARLLRFVGDAEKRIEEDYLRILRFCRFLAQYQLTADMVAIQAIQKLSAGLLGVSAERIGQEMKRFLSGSYAPSAFAIAKQANLIPRLLSGFQSEVFENWRRYRSKLIKAFDWRVELVATHADNPGENWRLSNDDSKWIDRLKEAYISDHPPHLLGQFYGEEIGEWALHLKAAQANEQLTAAEQEALCRGANAEFPIRGGDLLPIIPAGLKLGELLDELYQKWCYNNFALDRAALLRLAQEMIKSEKF